LMETALLLHAAGAVGVWGNHDFGLCREPSESMRREFGPVALGFMAGLRPRLVIGDCLFTHLEPWRDPERIEHLWPAEDGPDPAACADASFAAAPHRFLFAGHYHCW